MNGIFLRRSCLVTPLTLQLRIYAQPSQIHTAEYAANVTKIIFDYFEEYFDMEYSIQKLGKYVEKIYIYIYYTVYKLYILSMFPSLSFVHIILNTLNILVTICLKLIEVL